MSITQPAFFLLLNIAVLAVFWISSEKINIGELQVGQLVAFGISFPCHVFNYAFSMVFIMYPRAEVSANRIKELLNEEPLIKNPENGIKDTENKGIIEFDNVTLPIQMEKLLYLRIFHLLQKQVKQSLL